MVGPRLRHLIEDGGRLVRTDRPLTLDSYIVQVGDEFDMPDVDLADAVRLAYLGGALLAGGLMWLAGWWWL
jgi:hypothetical protein